MFTLKGPFIPKLKGYMALHSGHLFLDYIIEAIDQLGNMIGSYHGL